MLGKGSQAMLAPQRSVSNVNMPSAVTSWPRAGRGRRHSLLACTRRKSSSSGTEAEWNWLLHRFVAWRGVMWCDTPCDV